MNRSEFIKRMGAAALIPFVPNRTNYIDSTIILNVADNPLNYRTLIHAYDMTLETVMDEYTPYDNSGLEYGWEQFEAGGDLTGFDAYRRTMTLSGMPDNYDRYELSVWKTERIGQIAVVQPIKVFSRTYHYDFPPEVWINLHIGQQNNVTMELRNEDETQVLEASGRTLRSTDNNYTVDRGNHSSVRKPRSSTST